MKQNIKILKITCFGEKTWEGKVILREELKFEGIVVNTSNDDDNLITGTLVDLGTTLMKFSKPGVFPCSFCGYAVENSAIGKWTSHDSFSAHDAGTGEIIFAEIALEEETVKDISQRIERFKMDMDRFSSEIYESFVKYIDVTAKEFMKSIDENKEAIENEIRMPLKKLKF